ncbi:hypothetical protein BGX26_003657 [Mortierella sp. AD094]|nr:hypothetical protein BGX26_003657 [Mortierella sp. AD094]
MTTTRSSSAIAASLASNVGQSTATTNSSKATVGASSASSSTASYQHTSPQNDNSNSLAPLTPPARALSEEDADSGGDDQSAVEATLEPIRKVSRRRRKSQFRKFQDPAYELILLKAIDSIKEAWQNVGGYLLNFDIEQVTKTRQEPCFRGVTHRLCQSKWEALSNEQRKYQQKMKKVTGVSPDVTERRLLMQKIHEYEQMCLNAVREERTTKYRKRKRVEDGRRAGQLLVEVPRIGSIRIHNDTDAEDTEATDLTDSDISSVSKTRTPLRKKRLHANALRDQYSSAIRQVQEHFEIQKQHFELLRRDWEERKEQDKIQQEMELERLRKQAERD